MKIMTRHERTSSVVQVDAGLFILHPLIHGALHITPFWMCHIGNICKEYEHHSKNSYGSLLCANCEEFPIRITAHQDCASRLLGG